MTILALIPARGGSKGLPGKNIKLLNGKPLIAYSINSALSAKRISKTVVSTDDKTIADISKKHGAEVPFMRPENLASDTASSRDVIIHTLDFFKQAMVEFDYLVLLQPTSPFRKEGDIDQAIDTAIETNADLVVSAFETSSNPYYVLFEENENGHLKTSKSGTFTRRQDCPKVYELNGSIYVFKTEALRQNNDLKFDKTVKFLMDKAYSVDIDTIEDFEYAEYLLQKNRVL